MREKQQMDSKAFLTEAFLRFATTPHPFWDHEHGPQDVRQSGKLEWARAAAVAAAAVWVDMVQDDE